MKINHAILHILDFDSAVNVMSQRELDIESRTVRNFVTTHLRRARTSADNKRATFAENSAFGGELKSYFFGEREFVDLSQQIAEFISSELTKAEKAESTDVLVADFDDDEDARWFAVMLLGSKQAFMHEVGREEGEVRNDIARHYAILPNPSQKVPSYAIVRASTMEIGYVDKKRKIAGED
ncbi:nucleoid-associated protein, partial [Collinsella aerofaciens]|uniref:nucleoid-associated protein n=2 Tax=Coriobacteriaceae TaxID=84107 RepID=UPI0034A3E593